MRDTTAEPGEPGVVASSVTMIRLIVGWACTALSLLNLAMGADPKDWPYLVFHGVLLATGLALLAVGLMRKRPGPVAWITGAAVTIAGMALSALPRTSTGCCMRGYPVRHGFPFTLLAHGGGWHLDTGRAIADLIFWCGFGLFALLLVTPLRRWRSRSTAAPARPQGTHGTHAEERTPAPRDENVGGLP